MNKRTMRFDNWLEAINYGRSLVSLPPVESTSIPEGSTVHVKRNSGDIAAVISLWDAADPYPFIVRP